MKKISEIYRVYYFGCKLLFQLEEMTSVDRLNKCRSVGPGSLTNQANRRVKSSAESPLRIM